MWSAQLNLAPSGVRVVTRWPAQSRRDRQSVVVMVANILAILASTCAVSALTVAALGTTTVSAATFTYDAPFVALVDVRHVSGTDAAETQLTAAREGSVSPHTHRGSSCVYDPSGVVDATEAAAQRETLFHYTDEAGQNGILDSGQLNPSLKSVNPADARYGNGQYLSDVQPGSMSCAQLSRCFLGQPFQGSRFTNYVEIDVTGLDIIKGRPGVFVNPSETPLDLTGRIVSWGRN